MGSGHHLPDPEVCRTRQLFDTGYYICCVGEPDSCPQLGIVNGTHICNHYLRRIFAREDRSVHYEDFR